MLSKRSHALHNVKQVFNASSQNVSNISVFTPVESENSISDYKWPRHEYWPLCNLVNWPIIDKHPLQLRAFRELRIVHLHALLINEDQLLSY